MAISNFGELKAGIQNWAARSDMAFVNRLPEFVTLGEDRIYNGGKEPLESPGIRSQEQATSADLTFTGNAAPLPPRFLEAYRIYFEGQPNKKLQYLTPREFHTTDHSPNTEQDPYFYTVEGNTMFIEPGSIDGTGRLGFYQSFASLASGSDDGTNALLLRYPSLFLYASLVAAFSWARNSRMATENFSLYASVAGGVHKSTSRAIRSGQTLIPQIINAT